MAENPFRGGDWADHKSGQLDPRKVTRVEGDQIWIMLTTQDYGPLPAAHYKKLPTRRADSEDAV